MDDAFLVAVVHGIADLSEQLQALPRAELLLIDVLRDGLGTDDVLHGEEGHGAAVVAMGAGFVYLPNAGMAQAGKDLRCKLEPPQGRA